MGLKGFVLFQSLVNSGQPIHLLYSCLEKVSNLGKRRCVARSPKGESWSISCVYLLGTHFPLVVRTNSQSTTKLLPIFVGWSLTPRHGPISLVSRMGKQKGFFFLEFLHFLGVEKKSRTSAKQMWETPARWALGAWIFFILAPQLC